MKLIHDLEGGYSRLFYCINVKTGGKLLTVFSFSRSRSKSRSHSPSQSRRRAHGSHTDDLNRGKDRAPKIEYITEFGGFDDGDEPKLEGYSPPPSPLSHADALNRSEHSTF